MIRIAIIIFPGSNCDRDMMEAIESITQRRPALIWHKDSQLDPVDLVIIPGGFSFGDYLRCGALAARTPAIEAVWDHASRGGAVLGVCNGFQILLEAGLLSGVLLKNHGLKFVCTSVGLTVEAGMENPFLGKFETGDKMTLPVAHNEGAYFVEDEEYKALQDNGLIALRYAENPNGSVHDIAGVLSSNGRVLGMMPHPERAMGNGHIAGEDGRKLLTSILEGVAQ